MPTTSEVVKKIISEVIECNESEVQSNSKIIADLGAESLDIIDLSYTLSKTLSIKMPTKTVLIHALESCNDEKLLIEDDCLTDVCVALLKEGPNKYDAGQIYPGMPMIDVFENTQVKNWVNLCETILHSASRDGDTVIEEFTENFLRARAKI